MSAEEEDEYDGEGERSEARATLAQGGGTSTTALEEAVGDAEVVGATAVRDDGDDGQEVQVEKKRKRRYSGTRLRAIRLQRST